MAKVKIISNKTFTKKGVCKLEGGSEVVYWLDSAFVPLLVEGAEVDMEVETKPKHDNPDQNERWIKSVNGTPAKQQRQGGGGGGRPMAPPRDEDIIVAQVIIKEACESARMNATRESRALDLNEVRVTAKALVDIYHDTHKALKVTA